MRTFTHAFTLLLTLLSTQAFANDKAKVETVTDGIKDIAVCTKFHKKPVIEKSNAVGDFEYRIKAPLYDNQISVVHRDVTDILKLDAEKIEVYEGLVSKSTLKETIKYKKDPISFLSEIDNLEQIITETLTAAQEVEADEKRSQERIDTYIEESTCSLQIVQLIKKEYSKK